MPDSVSQKNNAEILSSNQIADFSPNLLYVIDLPQQKIVYVNNRVEDLLGLKKEEVYREGSNIFKSVLHPEDYDKRLENLEKCKQLPDQEEIRVEVRFKTGSKDWQWFRITYKVYKHNSQGEVLQVICTAEKIHEEKVSKEKLKEQEELLKATMSSSTAMIQVFDAVRNAEGEIVDFKWKYNNQASEDIYGDVIGKGLLKYNPGVVKEGIFDTFKKVVETGVSNISERHYVHEQFDGWFSQSAVKLGDGLVTTTTNITDLKKAQQRQDFLLAVNDALRPLSNPAQIEGKATHMLRKHLGAGWCYYNQFGDDQTTATVLQDSAREGLPSLAGTHDLSDIPLFLEHMKEGKVLNEADFTQSSLLNQRVMEAYTKLGMLAMLAVPIVSAGRLLAVFLVADTQIRQWKEEEVRLVQEVAERTWVAVERAKAEQALQESELKYRSLFETMDQGFGIGKVVTASEATGDMVDWQWLEVNPQFEHLTGLSRDAVLGQSIRKLVPNLEETWFSQYAKVAATGESIAFEDYSPELNRWFNVYVYALGTPAERRVAVLFTNTTEQKQREQKQSFLLKLGDALSPLSDANEVQRVAMQVLGEHLKVDRAIYAEINIDEDWFEAKDNYTSKSVQKLTGRFPFTAFGPPGEKLKKGESLIIHDVTAEMDEDSKKAFYSMDVHAVVAVPFIKQGKLVADLSVHQNTPRHWLDHEIEIIRETAERTWAAVERAKAEEALQTSEEKFRTLFESIDEGYCLIEVIYNEKGEAVDIKFLEVNAAFEKNTGVANIRGKLASEVAPNEDHWLKAYDEVVKTGKPLRLENYNAASNRWYSVYAARVSQDSRQLNIVFNDITESKQREQQQSFLLELGDALRFEADPLKIQSKAARVLGEHLGAGRVAYAEIEADDMHFVVHRDYTHGVPSFAGRYPLDSYAPAYFAELRAGRTVTVTDAERDPQLSETDRASYAAGMVRAAIAVPLIKGDRLAVVFFLHYPEPHRWTDSEVSLVEETAERTWAAVERAKAEEAVHASQKRFHSIANLVPDLLWESEPNGFTNWYNQRWLEYTGQSMEQATGWGWVDAIHPDDRKRAAQRYGEAAEAGKPFRQEHRLRSREGEYRWFVINALPLTNENGQVIKTYGSATDIHDRRHIEEARRKSEQRLQKALSIGTVGVLFFDLNLKFHHANDAFLNMIGYSRQDLEWGRLNSEEVTLPEYMPRTRKAIQELKETGRFSPYEKELIRPDGSRWWGLFAGMRLSENECVEFIVDITATKKAEGALVQAKEKAEKAARAKEDFLSTMSHEIRTPLNAVIGLTNLLLTSDPKESQKEYLKSLSFSARNLLALINDILDFSKLEAGKVELKENDFDLMDLLENLKESHDPQAREKRTKVRLEVDERIPHRITADQVKLSQILNNLLSNAIKFTPEGEVTVSVQFNRQDEEVVWLDFSVKDTGIGIAPDKAEYIFEKFAQAADSPLRKYGGTGLGLSITKLLLDLMGSEIHVESTAGKGSNFYFSLPVVSTEDKEHREEFMTKPAVGRHPGDISILLVEDVEINRDIVKQFLSNWWQLIPDEAVNGQEAVEMAKEKKYDLILMDIRMPVLDGYEATKQIRKLPQYRKTPILALTADKSMEKQQVRHETQFDDLLTKPFEPEDLKEKILENLCGEGLEEPKACKENKTAEDLKEATEAENFSMEEPSFNLKRYEKMAAGNREILHKWALSSLKAMETYKEEFIVATNTGNLKMLSDLVHQNTSSVYYLHADRLAAKIQEFREVQKRSGHSEELRNSVLQEFDNIIEGLKRYVGKPDS